MTKRFKTTILKILGILTALSAIFVIAGVIAVAGYVAGYARGVYRTAALYGKDVTEVSQNSTATPLVTPNKTPNIASAIPTWGGPQLWEAVNKKRAEYGVNPLNNKDELCTIAAIRLNEILAMGKLDGHEGFGNMPERRPDLLPIFEKYTISEFLLSGAQTPDEAVELWENTLGHKKLLTGGEYVWGCIYAQSGFAVAIAAY